MAQWQIPRGLTQGTWDYIRGENVANSYDQFLEGTPLSDWEASILREWLPGPDEFGGNSTGQPHKSASETVIDFGAGTGRSLIPIVQRGYVGVAVDLSIPMLEKLGEKLASPEFRHLNVELIRANLVELDGLESDSCDHGVCLFSTLGMIQGRESRLAFLGHARRIISNGGYFMVHAHNYWNQLWHPGGLRWIAGNAFSSLTGKSELGDRISKYRGINNMFIHSFRKSELLADLRRSGFEIEKVHPLKPDSSARIRMDIGWIIACK